MNSQPTAGQPPMHTSRADNPDPSPLVRQRTAGLKNVDTYVASQGIDPGAEARPR